MGTVWVVQESLKHDLSPAAEYGQLKVLCPPGDVTVDAQPIVDRIREKLADFSDKDYLLLTGDPIMLGTAMAIADAANNGVVNVLKWSRKNGCYFPVRIQFP
jgi:hypothetical protein